MTPETLNAIWTALDRAGGFARKVRNANQFILIGPTEARRFLPLSWALHVASGGSAEDSAARRVAAAQRGALLGGLRRRGLHVICPGDPGFDALFEEYLQFGRAMGGAAARWEDGRRIQLAGNADQWEFWVPPLAQPDRAAVLSAIARLAAGEAPEGFGTARLWFVRHPDTGALLPAKMVWGLATGQSGRDFNAHQARDGLRRLGFDVPGPDQPAAEIAESPESLAALPPAFEGAERQVTRNIRERDPAARRAAEAHWRQLRGGLICEGCGIDFGRAYGPRGAGFMHFHHLTPLAAADGPRAVDGARDLVPLCPNCHAMVHRGEDLLTIDALRDLLGLPPQQL